MSLLAVTWGMCRLDTHGPRNLVFDASAWVYGHYAMTFVYASVSAAALEEAIWIAEGELTLWIQKSLINFPARL